MKIGQVFVDGGEGDAVPPMAEEKREAHRCGEEEVGAGMAVGGAAGGIAEAYGKHAGLFCPGDGVVTRPPGGPRRTSRLIAARVYGPSGQPGQGTYSPGKTLAKELTFDWMIPLWRTTSATVRMYGSDFLFEDRGDGSSDLSERSRDSGRHG